MKARILIPYIVPFAAFALAACALPLTRNDIDESREPAFSREHQEPRWPGRPREARGRWIYYKQLMKKERAAGNLARPDFPEPLPETLLERLALPSNDRYHALQSGVMISPFGQDAIVRHRALSMQAPIDIPVTETLAKPFEQFVLTLKNHKTRYRLVQFGGSQDAVDQIAIDQKYELSQQNGERNVRFYAPVGSPKALVWQRRRNFFSFVHWIVENAYYKMAGSPMDYGSLTWDDIEFGPNSKTYVMMLDGDYDLDDLDDEEKEKSLFGSFLATIRLSRDRPESFAFPSQVKGLANSFFPVRNSLPFQKRMRLKENAETIRRFEEFRGSRSVAEITRFLRLRDFPRPLRKALLLRLFEDAIAPPHPVEMLVFAASAEHEQDFAWFPFSRVGELKMHGGETQTLKYLYTDSDEFKKMLADLRKQSAVSGLPQNSQN